MRLAVFFSCIIPILFCSDALAKRHAKNEHLDATGGKVRNHQIVFITRTENKNLTHGTAILVLRKSGIRELAYGYYRENETARLGSIDDNKVVALDKHKGPNISITTVEVTPEQYKATQKIINNAIDIPNGDEGLTTVFCNNAKKILKACNMKIPYISPYRPPNPTQFVGDIPAYSRDLVIGK